MHPVFLYTPIFANFSSSVESLLIHDQKYGKVFRQRSRQANLCAVGRPQCRVDGLSQSRLQIYPYYMSWPMQLIDIIGREIFEVIKMVANGLICYL